MPKGIKNPKSIVARDDHERVRADQSNALVVPVGATHFPTIDGGPGEELPVGISVRSRRSIQLEYSLNGRQTLRLPQVPTVQAVRAAAKFRERLVDAIADNASEELIAGLIRHAVKSDEPASPAKASQSGPASVTSASRPASKSRTNGSMDEMTCGQMFDEYLCVRWTALSPNTKRDYVGYVRGRLKSSDISELALPADCFIEGRHTGPQPPDADITETRSAATCHEPWRRTSTVPCVREYVDVPLEADEAPSGRWKRRRAAWKRAGGEDSGPSPESTKRIAVVRAVELPLCCLGQLRVSALTDVVASGMVALWLRALERKTVVNLLAFIRPACERLVAKGIWTRNPFGDIKVTNSELSRRGRAGAQEPADEETDYLSRTEGEAKLAIAYERDESEPDPLSDDEMVAVLEHCEAEMRDHHAFGFMTGLRTGEQLALRAKDYDRHNARIRVRRSQSRGIEKRPKSGSGRWVSLNAVATEVLERRIQRCGPDDYIFVNPHTGQPWRGPNKITKRWQRAMAAAGVRYRRPYHTRHTYATLMLLAGESPYFVAAQLGHADLEMLERRYARFIEAGRARKPGAAMAVVHASTLETVSKLLASPAAPALDGDSGFVASADEPVHH